MRTRNAKKLGWLLMAALLVLGCPGKKNPCRNPKYVQAMKDEAIAYYSQGRYLEAQKSASAAVACKPKDPELYYYLGLIHFQRGKYYDAIAAFQKSLDQDPNFAESHVGLGAVYLSLQRWDEAIKEFEAAAAADYFTRPWEAYNNIGWAYLQKGDLALAEQNFKKAISLNNKYCPAYCNLGELYARQNRRPDAVALYQKAIALCLNNYARPHFLLGVEYGKMGAYQQACDELAIAAKVTTAPEANQALEYMRIYNCPGVVMGPPI